MGLATIRARPCGGCSISYDAFRSGFSFADASQALKYSADVDASGNGRRFYGRRSVLRQMCRWKVEAWDEHLRTCGAGIVDLSDAPWRAAHGRWYLTLDEDARTHLEADAGDELMVELDGDVYRAILGTDHRLVVQAHWRDLVLPCSWVRVSNRVRWRDLAANQNELEDAPF